MAAKVKPIPEGYHTVTPYLVVDGAEKVIRFMKEAFGAQPVFEPMMRPDGKVMHAEFKIGDSVVMISDASERAKATSTMLHLYVPNVDAVYEKAVKAGGHLGDGAVRSVLWRPQWRREGSSRQSMAHRHARRGRRAG